MNPNRSELPWKLTSPTALFTLLLSLFVLFLSVYALFDPTAAAQGFGLGLHSPDDIGWLQVKAGRDLGVALALFFLVTTRQRRAAGLFVVATIVMPVMDALTILRHGASLAYALSVHGSAAIYGVVLAIGLLGWPRRAVARAATA